MTIRHFWPERPRPSRAGVKMVMGLAVVICVSPSLAQTPAPDASGKDVAVPSGFKLAAGYLLNLHARSGHDTGYYRAQYDGNALFARGDPFQFSNPAAAQSFSVKDAPEGFKFRLDNSEASAGGGILDSIFRRSLPVHGLERFNMSVGVNAQSNFKAFTYQGGVESPVMNPLKALNRGPSGGLNIVNWVFVSSFVERQKLGSSGGKDQDVGVASYRALVGRGWNPVSTNKTQQFNEDVWHRVRELSEKNGAFDYEFFKKSVAPLAQGSWVDTNLWYLSDLDTLHQLDLSHYTTDKWEDLVRTTLVTAFKPVKNFNTIQFWVETAGWYQFTGTAASHRFTDLTAANLRFYVGPKDDVAGRWVGLRFENGTERSTPGVHKNFIAAEVGFALK